MASISRITSRLGGGLSTAKVSAANSFDEQDGGVSAVLVGEAWLSAGTVFSTTTLAWIELWFVVLLILNSYEYHFLSFLEALAVYYFCCSIYAAVVRHISDPSKCCTQ